MNLFQLKKDIKGILKDENKLEKISLDSNILKDYKSWKRSHANNWNSKFFDSDQINKNNIQNLKLLWKFSTIENDELENK